MNNSFINILNATGQDKFKELLSALNKSESDVRQAAAFGNYIHSLNAPVFTQEELDSTEWCGYTDFTDAEYFRGLSILPDVQTHYSLYGKSQGRSVLERLEKTDVKNVVIIAPSYGKQCGIGEYGRYLESSFKAIGKTAYSYRTSAELLRQSDEFIRDSLVLVNHGPGLFDGFNPKLGQGESTNQLLQNLLKLRDKGAFPAFMMHSLIDTDQELLYSRQQMILNSEIPVITFITDASRNFYIPQVELGVSPVKKPKNSDKGLTDRSTRQEVVGFFGFFQYGGKDFDALFHLVGSLRAKLAGSVATSNVDELKRFTDLLDSSDITHELGSGWVIDKELAERLSKADYFYLPQNDYDHWNNSATARFVMNLERPVFLPAHQPFLDVEDGAVFSSTEDLPRIVSHFRQDEHYKKAVEKATAFRKKADMRNTAKALLSGAYTDFREKSRTSTVSDSDTSIQRFLSLSDERKTLYLSTMNTHSAFDVKGAVDLLNNGVFSALYKSVDRVAFWRKHYNLEDFVQHSLLESVHTTYRNVCKRDVEIAELVSICRYKLEQETTTTPGNLLSHTLKNALSVKGNTRRFHKPDLAIYYDHCAVQEEHISPDHLNDLIVENLAYVGQVNDLEKNSVQYKPFINNVLEIIVQPIHELDNREFNIDLSLIDMESVLTCSSLYERYNKFVSLCSEQSIDIIDHLIVDKPIVREVEHERMQYELEDLYFYHEDMFVCNAVRSLFKREPFPIEFLAMRSMLDNLGKFAVLTYLNSNISSRAHIADMEFDRCALLDQDYNRFTDVIRDPIAGGIELRNRYCVELRNNYRWWLATKGSAEAYTLGASGDLQAILALYYHLCSSDTEFSLYNTGEKTVGNIENWLTIDGTFVNPETTVGSRVELKSDLAMDIHSIDSDQTHSMINFHKIEAEGAWTKERSAHMLIAVNEEGVDPALHSYSLSVKLRSYGSAKVPGRAVRVSVVSDKEDAVPVEVQGAVSDDAAKIFSLPLNDVAGSKYFIVQFYISSTTNPHILDKSPDDRELGLMVQQLCLHRMELPVEPLVDDTNEELIEESNDENSEQAA